MYAVIAIAILLVAVVVTIGLVRGRRKSELKELPVTDTKGRAGGGGSDDGDGSSIAIPAPRTDLGVDFPPSTGPADSTVGLLERPEAPAGRLARLRARLAGSNKIGKGLLALLSRGKLDDETWDEVEATLLTSDLGVGPTAELMEQLKLRVKVASTANPAEIREILRSELLALVDPAMDRSLNVQRNIALEVPAVVMVVGVNGTGKTTTAGKLARLLVADDEDVLMGAADTFRAAAAEQLTTWGERVGVPVVRGPEGGDPASVAFEAVSTGVLGEVDVVLIDTAGRLHTKVGLMDELGKVKRVIEKKAPVTEVLLVLDATTGQNGLVQAKVFAEVVAVTGVVLTKLDGSAKGGIVVAVQRELGVPVKLVGLGEGPDDLAPFDPVTFVDALLD